MFFSFRSWALWRVVGPLLAIVLLLGGLSAGSLQVMSAVRAYVAGESMWSKGQKDAIHYLQTYVSTGAPLYLQKFDAAIAVPLAEASVKRRAGGPVDEPADVDAGGWAGVIPMQTVAGAPEADAWSPGEVPADVADRARALGAR